VTTVLNTGASVTLNASGAGTVTLGPNTGPPVWRVTKITVSTSRIGQPPVPNCTIYLGPATPNNQVANTYDGSFDESAEDILVTRGQVLTAVWAGGQSGDVATLSVYGERRMQ
jgi:hypothetical protein